MLRISCFSFFGIERIYEGYFIFISPPKQTHTTYQIKDVDGIWIQ
jgi:hypothetical protein